MDKLKFYLYNLPNKHIVSRFAKQFGLVGIELTVARTDKHFQDMGFTYDECNNTWSKPRESFATRFHGSFIPHRAPVSPKPHGYRTICNQKDPVTGDPVNMHYKVW